MCVSLIFAAGAQAITFVAPNYAATNQNSGGEGMFVVALRQQTVYGSSEFPPYPIVINDIRWRPDTAAGGPITVTISNLQINLSTTQAKIDQLNTTFAQNIGTNDTVVFSGAMNVVSTYTTLSDGTKTFDIDLPLQTSFLFDPSKGNLLVDVRNFTGCSANLYDNSTGSDGDMVSRAFTTDPNAISATTSDTAGGVIQIGYIPAPVPPTIISQPTNRTITAGTTATFSVTAGPLPLSYQWFYNTNNLIGGATNSSLTLTNVQPGQAGNYSVQVTGSYGLTLSSNALLTVTTNAPTFTSQPASQPLIVGNNVTFTASVTGSLPLTYQWFFNSTNVISGATNGSLILTNVQISQLGAYSVQVTNIHGSANSSNAYLTVGVIAPNYAVTNQVSSGEGMFVVALRQQTVYGSSEFPPYPIVINDIRWRPDTYLGGPLTTTISNIQVNLSTTQAKADQLNSTFAQNIGTNDVVVFSGAMNVVSTYTTLSNSTKAFDIDLPLQTSFLFDPSRGNLLVDVRNFTGCSANLYDNSTSSGGDTVSRAFTTNPNATSASTRDTGGGVIQIGYIPAPLPPTIASQPTNRTITAGTTATFSVTAGPLPLSYQWFYNTNNLIGGATNSSLTLTNVQPGQAGNYSVQVTGSYGVTLSSNAVLIVTTNAPVFTSQPASQTSLLGNNVTFTASVTGSLPLTYQWFFNTNTLITGATNSSLVLTNVQIGQTGTYSLLVSNAYGTTNSTNALLTVTFPPATIRFRTTNVMGGNPVDVSVFLIANGNENTLSFSMNFPTQRMTYASITLGTGAADAGFLPNTSQATSGRIGVTLQLPSGETFASGTQEVVRVTFLSAILIGVGSILAPINFTNQPINKLLFDAQDNKLATNFLNGTVTILPSVLEGDVIPRPIGDQSLDIFDWSQVGRFVAGLDVVTNAAEFQRTDCAPKSTLGDGQLKVTDWVQAGRYGAGIDSPVAAGGPSATTPPTLLTGGPRILTIGGGTAMQGLTLTLPITVQSQGSENAMGFSLSFDPAVLRYSGTVKGSAAISSTMNVNTNQAASGVVGMALALSAGNTFASGTQEIARVTFTALISATNNTIAFSDGPVLRAISDPLANELSANYSNSIVTINPPPVLTIGIANTNAVLSWPTWATGFNLQATGILPVSAWTNVSSITQTNSGNVSVTLPMLDLDGYFRLLHP